MILDVILFSEAVQTEERGAIAFICSEG